MKARQCVQRSDPRHRRRAPPGINAQPALRIGEEDGQKSAPDRACQNRPARSCREMTGGRSAKEDRGAARPHEREAGNRCPPAIVQVREEDT